MASLTTATLSSQDLSILMTDCNDADGVVMWEDAEKAIAAISLDFTLDHGLLKEILKELDLLNDPTPSIQKCVGVLATAPTGWIHTSNSTPRSTSSVCK